MFIKEFKKIISKEGKLKFEQKGKLMPFLQMIEKGVNIEFLILIQIKILKFHN